MPVYVTCRTVLQKVRGRAHKALPQLVNTGFQVLFHSPPGVLFTFPSQYYSLSVTKEYLALRGGPRVFPQGFSCLVVLWILLVDIWFSLTGLSPSMAGLSRSVLLTAYLTYCSPNPGMHASRFGLFPVRSPLLWKSIFLSRKNSFFFLFLRLLRCFSSPGSLRIPIRSFRPLFRIR